ncbi:MAG TPA: lysophospholipid acyltransferase family protein [Armatimonadota bacterium]|nr:lysophospholipid acyltransferase family protein [Armatimonadota bacterium]
MPDYLHINRPLYAIGRNTCWVLAKLFGRLRVHGRGHVPTTGGVLLAANHTSYADPPLVGVGAPRRVHYMAKAELFAVPVLGALIARVGAFPVRRGTADRQALRIANDLLTAGEAVVIFFEGGRSPDGRLLPPELGPAMIALKAGVPIVPTAIINADKMLPPKGAGLRFAHVQVSYGTPLTFPHLAGKAADRAALREVALTVARAVADLLRAHGAADRVPEGYPTLKTGESEDEGEE